MEAVIAIGILITSVVIIISLSIATTDFGRRAESRNLATNLAREGLELVRQKRDSNWLSGIAFYSGLFPTTTQVGLAGILDPGNTTYVSLLDGLGTNGCYSNRSCTCYTSATGFCKLSITANGVYSNFASGTETPYRRMIFIEPKDKNGVATTDQNAAVSLHVVSQVYWLVKNVPQYVTLETDLYDWKTNNP